MAVLHVTWQVGDGGRLYIWGERAQVTQTIEVTARGKLRPHPFSLLAVELDEQLAGMQVTPSGHRGAPDVLALLLPSSSRSPLPSPQLLLETPVEVRSQPQLRGWLIEALSFDAQAACDLLLSLPVNPPSSEDYNSYGSDTRFWMCAAQLALELVQHQSFLPAIHSRVNGRGDKQQVLAEASWDLALLPEDRERVSRLAAAMPPVCRALLVEEQREKLSAQDLLLHFLRVNVDALVRDGLQSMMGDQSRLKWGKSLPSQWLRALRMSQASPISASFEELRSFIDSISSWLRPVTQRAAFRSFRTCFRLEQPSSEEPEEENRESSEPVFPLWKLSFHLQANDDPSLLVPAEKAWQVGSDSLSLLNRSFERPQEALLSDLGAALRLYPTLAKGLRSARPSELALSTEEAYTFLRDAVPLLKAGGFGVLVPPWWGGRATRLSAKLRVRQQREQANNESQGYLSLDSILTYDWQVSVGGQVLNEQEFMDLVALKQPLVNVRGQWIELRPEEMETAASFFEKKLLHKKLKFGDLLRLEAGAEEHQELGLSLESIEVEGWLSETLKRLSGQTHLEPVPIPSTFQGQLRPYQVRGVSWLAFLKSLGLGACLADDMGLGKTASLIGLLLYERSRLTREKKPFSPTLIVCPMSIVGNWQRELQRFSPSLNVHVHHGADRFSGEEFVKQAHAHDVVLTTYALTLRDQELLTQINWENVVLDEAQNIKNDEAKQTQAIKKLKSHYRIALTGTPVENRLSELRSIIEFLNPGFLGSGKEFRQRYTIPIERYRDKERAQVLKQLVQPFVLRRVKTDKSIIQDLPEKMEMKVLCNLTQEQASLYEAVVKEMLEKIESAEGIERRGLILAALMRLKQVCNHPAQFMSDGSELARRSGKLSRLEEMLEEVLASGEKALIFTQFAEMGQLLRQHLQESFGREVLFLHGATPKKQRDQLVQRFQGEGEGAPIFLLSLKAGGVGLNLTEANHVFHFDRWWNPAVENQATDRAFRIGQRRNVQVHKFVCVGTLEERIDAMIEGKKELAENVIGNGENWLTEMSTKQLRELFVLGREAVGE
ncbi:DEAD/DEAH box helicase [Ktedonospora formicarum]|uniref:ATP-dependent helicase n=1 Tax=Ktedonospora formicarum TaxID=2778364 RepID=A0A8J3MTA6_9CHLR|nr:DEAD/DEAH box helicase [Ktedonospora formicarum]GHO45701.1 ATP-dependent helicase [Ktedonospora formicarum]